MATTATPTGAEPVGTLSSSGSFTGRVRHIPIATTYDTAIFYGDFVHKVTGGTVEVSSFTTTVQAGIVGIFLGCQYTDPTTGQFTASQQWPADNAATDAVALVADDPFLLFKMQASAAVAASSMGFNIAAIMTAGSTAMGRSKNALDGTTEATTGTLPLRIIEFVDGPFSAAGDAFTDIIVTYLPGSHVYLKTTAI